MSIETDRILYAQTIELLELLRANSMWEQMPTKNKAEVAFVLAECRSRLKGQEEDEDG